MNWHSNPKVRLALIVNGLYFISFFTTPSPHNARPHFLGRGHARRDEIRAERLPAKALPTYAPLAPPSGPSKAATHYSQSSDQLDVYLTNDLTLVRRRGHTLQFSPTFTAKVINYEPPRSVLMRFVSYSQQQAFDSGSTFVITADGEEMWRSGSEARALHSAAYDESGQVVETFGQSISYDIFLDIISARRVIIELGHDRVELTTDQVEALRDMHRRLPHPPPAPAETTADSVPGTYK